MKKIFLASLCISVIYFGCEKDFDLLVDQSPALYQVTGVRTIDSVKYIPNDSLLLITITFNKSADLRSVFADIYASDGSKLNKNSFSLLDNGKIENGDFVLGDNTFSNKFPLSEFYPIGVYTINYFAQDKNKITKQVAIQKFKYDNGQTNIPPIISNLAIPDTIARGFTFIFSVFASDSNGLNDVEKVYFELFRPDGSQVDQEGETKFLMHDDGNYDVFGDQTPQDGIYSYKNSFGITADSGQWKFIFRAIDRGKKLSNIITHFIQVQ